MAWRLERLAQLLDAQLQGEPGFEVLGLNAPEQAQPDELICLLEPQWRTNVLNSAAQVVLAPFEVELDKPHLLRVRHPRKAFAQLLELFYPSPEVRHQQSAWADIAADVLLEAPVEIGPFVQIGAGSQVGAGTKIASHVHIGSGCKVGRNCQLGPQVVLTDGVQLGDRVIVHAGTVIGADGYGFYQEQGRHFKIPQVGSVVVEDDVEIGANVTIDRGTLGNTRIGAGTKIDNLVQIGHNVQIGKHCLLVAQVGISGSTQVGDQVVLAGQTGVAGHLQIGDRVVAAGKSGITRSIPAGTKISGFPAEEHRKSLRIQAAQRQLPELIAWWKKQAGL